METRKTSSPSRDSKSSLCSRRVPFFPQKRQAFDGSKICPRVNTCNSNNKDNAGGVTTASSPAARRRTYSEGTQDKPVIKLVRPATSDGKPHFSPLVISMSYISPTSPPDGTNSPVGYDTILISPKKDKNDVVIFKYHTPEKICDETRQRACSLGTKKKPSKYSPATREAVDTKTSSVTNIRPITLSNGSQDKSIKSAIKDCGNTPTTRQRAVTTDDNLGAAGRQNVAMERISRIPIRRRSNADNAPAKVKSDQRSSPEISGKTATFPRNHDLQSMNCNSRPRAYSLPSLDSKVKSISSRIPIRTSHDEEIRAENQGPYTRPKITTTTTTTSVTNDTGSNAGMGTTTAAPHLSRHATPSTSSPLHTPQDHTSTKIATTTQCSTSAIIQGTVVIQNGGQPCPTADHGTLLSDHQKDCTDEEEDDEPLQPPISISFLNTRHNASAEGTRRSQDSRDMAQKHNATPTNRWDATPTGRATPRRNTKVHNAALLQELLEKQTSDDPASRTQPSLASSVPTTTNKHFSSPVNIPDILILNADGVEVMRIRPVGSKLPSWDSIDRTLECNDDQHVTIPLR